MSTSGPARGVLPPPDSVTSGAIVLVCRRDPAWSYHELDRPHFLMMSHPGEVAAIILDA